MALKTNCFLLPRLSFYLTLPYLDGTSYLILIDYYGKYIDVQTLVSTGTKGFIIAFKASFPRSVIPKEVVYDNASRFDWT